MWDKAGHSEWPSPGPWSMTMSCLCPASWPSGLADSWSPRPHTVVSEGGEVLLLCPKPRSQLHFRVMGFKRQTPTDSARKGVRRTCQNSGRAKCLGPRSGRTRRGQVMSCLGYCPQRIRFPCPSVRLLDREAGPAWEGPCPPPAGGVKQPRQSGACWSPAHWTRLHSTLY